MRCCVPFCKTTAEIVSESEDITFHEFPREVHLRDAWLKALGKQDTLLPAGAVVCSQHFLDNEIHETESGPRQIRTGAVPATVLLCLICLDTRSKLLLMSEYKLEQSYQHLLGHPPCGGGRLKQTLCVQCALRLVDFSTFRDESLQARSLMTELLHTHEVITRRHVALLSRYKHPLPYDIEPEHCDVDTALDATATATDTTVKREHEDTPAAAEAEAETLAPLKREHTCEPESPEDRTQASVAPVVLAPNPGYEENLTDSSDEWDILSFENKANVLKDPRKSQDTGLIPKESLATISDSIDYRTTRRNDRFTNEHEQSKHSQGIFSTQSGNHTDRVQVICDVCQNIFSLKASLVSHIGAQTFAKFLSCKLCKYKCAENSNLVKHMRTHTGEKLFACELCKYKCTTKSNFVIHMRTHTGEKPFACELCKYKYTTKYSLLRHMRTHTGENLFACELCKYKCTTKSHFVMHMRTHTGEKPFACELCKYKCTTKYSLKRHMLTHTGEKPFACKLCKYKCTSKSNLVNHMRTHTGEKPFACKLCKYKFMVKGRLVSHMKTHTGEKPFACKLCKYKCIFKGSLRSHMRTHTGERPFACKLCKYEGTTKSCVVTHMRTHTGEKPFACELCKYKCTIKGSLVNHMRTHTSEKPYACRLCKYKFKVKGSLLRHMAKSHSLVSYASTNVQRKVI